MGIKSNNLAAAFHDFFSRSGKDAVNPYVVPPPPPPVGIEATGGTVSDYESGSNIYRAHIFTTPGSFQVTTIDTGLPATIDVLVVGGGGGGGHNIAAGGGAGGLRSLTNVPVASIGTYPVTIGNGGTGSGSGATNGVLDKILHLLSLHTDQS